MPNVTRATPTRPSSKGGQVESPKQPTTAAGIGGEQVRPFRRKRRAWLFRVGRTTNHGVTEANLLASVCKRYRTVKTLIIKPDGLVAPASTCANATPQQPLGKKAAPASDSDSSSTTFVEITFAGPQPSENCGALLCLLLGGDSVQAWPVELPRGRKRKNTGSSTSEASAEEISEDAASSGPPCSSASSGVPRTLPPSPTPTKEPKPEPSCGEEETQPPKLPRYPLVAQRRQQQQQQQQHQRHYHHHHHHHLHQAGTVDDDAMFGLSPSFPTVPPPLGARPVKSEEVESRGTSGAVAPYFPAPGGGCGSSDSLDGGGGRTLLPMEDVRVEPSRQECDLEGRPFPAARTMAGGRARTVSGPTDDRQCHLIFTGLEETGHDLNSLRVTALFGVDAVHQTATVTSPLQVGEDRRSYSSVFYPSLQEIWPELYAMHNVEAVEVDIEVEILSDSGVEYRYNGLQLKVVYRRAPPPANINVAGEAARGHWGRRVPPQSPIEYPDDDFRPLYSQLCVDHRR